MKPKTLHDLDKISPWYVDLAFWRRWKSRVSGPDLEYMQNVSEALQAQSTPASSAFLYLSYISLIHKIKT